MALQSEDDFRIIKNAANCAPKCKQNFRALLNINKKYRNCELKKVNNIKPEYILSCDYTRRRIISSEFINFDSPKVHRTSYTFFKNQKLFKNHNLKQYFFLYFCNSLYPIIDKDPFSPKRTIFTKSDYRDIQAVCHPPWIRYFYQKPKTELRNGIFYLKFYVDSYKGKKATHGRSRRQRQIFWWRWPRRRPRLARRRFFPRPQFKSWKGKLPQPRLAQCSSCF